jgi:hypothetical protein
MLFFIQESIISTATTSKNGDCGKAGNYISDASFPHIILAMSELEGVIII